MNAIIYFEFKGPSMSGKTTLIFEILNRRNKIVDTNITNIHYVYGIQQPQYLQYEKEHPEIVFMPVLDESKLNSSSLVVFDDQMNEFETSKNNFITNFVTRSVHHVGCSCIFVLHNAFSPKLRTVALSTNYLIFFKQPRDGSTISNLSKQMFPGNKNYLLSAYKDCTEKPHTYIFIDLSQQQNDRYRVRSNIFVSDDCKVYVQ